MGDSLGPTVVPVYSEPLLYLFSSCFSLPICADVLERPWIFEMVVEACGREMWEEGLPRKPTNIHAKQSFILPLTFLLRSCQVMHELTEVLERRSFFQTGSRYIR